MGTNYYAPNSGYRGYSESVRAYEAKQEGKFPKTTFKRHYGISEKKFIELENRGVIYNSEWHHTSKFFNKTKFYAIENIILFYILIGKKQVEMLRSSSLKQGCISLQIKLGLK